MQIAVEDVSACRKKINVVVPSEELKEEFTGAYKERAKNVNVKGFRKGKVPLHILKKNYRQDVETQVLRKLISESCTKALEENSLEIIGDIEIGDENIKIKEGENLAFGIFVNIRPKLNLRLYKGLKLTSVSEAVNDKKIDAAINDLRERFSTLEEVKDRPVQYEDVVRVSYECRNKEGEEIPSFCKKDTYVLVSETENAENNANDFPIISPNLLGMSVGEKKEVESGVDDPSLSEKIGNIVTLSIDVSEIRKRVLPELNGEFAQKFAKQSIEELRDTLKKEMESTCEAELVRKLSDEAKELLVRSNPMEYPENMIDREVEQWKKKNEEMKKEKSPEEYETATADFREKVITDFKLGFILSEIAECEKIKISDDETKQRIEMLFHYAKKRDVQRAVDNQDYVENMRWEILKERVLEFVVNESDKVGVP